MCPLSPKRKKRKIGRSMYMHYIFIFFQMKLNVARYVSNNVIYLYVYLLLLLLSLLSLSLSLLYFVCVCLSVCLPVTLYFIYLFVSFQGETEQPPAE